MARSDVQDFPEGLRPDHLATPSHFTAIAAMLFWSTILFVGLLGIVGGAPHPVQTVSGDGGTMAIAAPHTIRNGEFFEIRTDITATGAMQDATLEISQSYLKDLTINTMIPAPEKEEALNGNFRFSFGPMRPGERLRVKIDGQINPPLFAGTDGAFTLYDGERRIASLPLTMRVWP